MIYILFRSVLMKILSPVWWLVEIIIYNGWGRAVTSIHRLQIVEWPLDIEG